MRINSINNVNFGKTLVAICNSKDANSGKTRASSLYEVDPKSRKDAKEIWGSKHIESIRRDFYAAKDYNSMIGRRFYILQDDKSKEIISCAETSKHYSRDEKRPGFYLSVEKLEGNKHYENATYPMVSYFAHCAKKDNMERISTQFPSYYLPEFKKNFFTETKDETLEIKNKRFSKVIEVAEKKNDIIFED